VLDLALELADGALEVPGRTLVAVATA